MEPREACRTVWGARFAYLTNVSGALFSVTWPSSFPGLYGAKLSPLLLHLDYDGVIRQGPV